MPSLRDAGRLLAGEDPKDVGREVLLREWRTAVKPYAPWFRFQGVKVGEYVGELIADEIGSPFPVKKPSSSKAPPEVPEKDKWVKGLTEPVVDPFREGAEETVRSIVVQAVKPWIIVVGVGSLAVGLLGGWLIWRKRG